ncbi:MAG: tRNA isopentenyl-2-thiomethyl-A-37 hydroxylase MiaE, partial [Pseudomonadales bacterium]
MKYTQLSLVPTPDVWLEEASDQLVVLLTDHANCEKKAASTALNLMYRYVEYPELLESLSKLAREELRHFEQVLRLMRDRGM